MKTVVFAGMLMTGVSFYSIGNVLCDELFGNACYGIHHTEHFYTVLPFFLPLFGGGIFLISQKNRWTGIMPAKPIILISTGVSVIVIGALVVYYVPDPNFPIPRPNPYAEAFKVLLPAGIVLMISGIVFSVRDSWK